MVLQSFLFPDRVCESTEIYYHVKGTYKEEIDRIPEMDEEKKRVVLSNNTEFSSDTYMNLMDADCWTRYTKIRTLFLRVTVSGTGKVSLMRMGRKKDKKLEEICFNAQKASICQFIIQGEDLYGMLYFCLEAETEVIFYGASFSCEDRNTQEVLISLVICTYKREEQLTQNLDQLQKSEFFREGTEWNRKLFVRVVDNAAEEKRENRKAEDQKKDRKNWNWNKGYGCFYQNRNTGGSGGFTRGILESQKDQKRFPATHILFMDDDVKFHIEAFYRLFALLSYIREEYFMEVVAGRMFCLDQRTVQYTASDIWNGGVIQHIGGMQDMSCRENLYRMNQERGEYSGWWFACFPMAYTIENLPMPFFLHCDDVEYGLRHGGQPIVLNGIQVWHETSLFRQSAMIHYYDVRNAAFTNARIGYSKRHLLKCWFLEFLGNMRHRQWQQEYMKLLAIEDYKKGENWLYQIDSEKNHQRICLEAKQKISVFLILRREIWVWIKVLFKK